MALRYRKTHHVLTRGLKNSARTPLSAEALEDRLLPSGMVDLTARGSEGWINEARFRQCDAQPTGTGVIRSFVRVQTANASGTLEQGYNTDGRPLQFDENKSPQFTRSLRLDDVPHVDIDGIVYREFLLDINQRSSQPLLSLDELRVYVGTAPDLLGYDPGTHQLAGLSPVYDLDADGDSWIKLNYRLNAGSGAGDIFAYIPERAFEQAQAPTDGYLYLYSKFGLNHAANSGFEEWAVRTNAPALPPPSPGSGLASLSGYVYVDANGNGIRDTGEVGIADVAVTLQGTDSLGRTVVLTATTDANGFYRFDNLLAGTYSILETQPEGYFDGIDTIGTQGGNTDNDRFFDIVLLDGMNGTDNLFGEMLPES